VFFQQLRVINDAMTVAYQLLVQTIGAGVTKQEPSVVGGPIYITEGAAQRIEQFVNNGVEEALKSQVQAVALQLSRTDDIGSDAGAIINATLQAECLAYLKGFIVATSFARDIAVPIAA
jgi:hypothetical protein